MASFSPNFPYAYHVLPLPALKNILQTNQLLSRVDLANEFHGFARQTTAAVDDALGLSSFVHFYLPKSNALSFRTLSILEAQLRPSDVPPFPHAVLKLSTGQLHDGQCLLCNFNAGVSRPAYTHAARDIRGGNHARRTAPEKIVLHWDRFKLDNPDAPRMRYSTWIDGVKVPLLRVTAVNAHRVGVNAPNSAGVAVPELLLESPFELPADAALYVFSQYDLETCELLPQADRVVQYAEPAFSWYDAGPDRVSPEIRGAINEYFAGDGQPPDLDFDRVRPHL